MCYQYRTTGRWLAKVQNPAAATTLTAPHQTPKLLL
jgi:hypothetical protein